MSRPAPAGTPPPGPDPAEMTPPPPRSWQQSALMALAAVALVLGAAWLLARSQSAHPFYGSVYSGDGPAYRFSGTDQNGRPWTFEPQGQVTLLFFGFTHCPDICPLTLSYLAKVRDRLPPGERDRVKVLFVSVDPERDTPNLIKDYVEYFGDSTGVRVPEPQLSQVAQAYKVAYARVPVEGPLKYQINHTTATYLIDEAGYIRALWDYSQLPNVDRILADVQYVMNNPTPAGTAQVRPRPVQAAHVLTAGAAL